MSSTPRSPILLLALPLLVLSACGDEDLVCPEGEVECGGRCASTLTDAAHCGACGHACGAEEACLNGTCAAGACAGGACDALQVACFATNDVRPARADLAAFGP
ncbi:MAG TPA: hypothetical protein VD838_12795, partial [Anaeromyxobacteraceae bacterium]|nr:hypothetical protein [Anaeromyxobacteraceae bacterium]